MSYNDDGSVFNHPELRDLRDLRWTTTNDGTRYAIEGRTGYVISCDEETLWKYDLLEAGTRMSEWIEIFDTLDEVDMMEVDLCQ